MSRTLISVLLALVLSTAGAFAGPLEDAGEAFDKGEFATAFQLYRQIAREGHPAAQFRLGDMYAQGQGVDEDPDQAMEWFKLSAGQGYALAQNALGDIYAAGKTVPRDVVAAESWYRRAAVQGEAKSQYSIGVMHAIGVGLPRNMFLAYMWFELSAALGDVNGAAARERMEFVMTDDELVRGQELARKCLASNYTDCTEGPVAPPESA
jgi:uncharacterized protein